MPTLTLPPDVVAWFHNERGIKPATLEAYRIGYENGALLLPYPDGTKKRYGIPDGERRFETPKGFKLRLFVQPDWPTSDFAFLVEGETDAMRLWQELRENDSPVHVYGLPGVNAWNEAMAEVLSEYDKVYVFLDNDEDYQVQATVDKAWAQIRDSLTPRIARRCVLPRLAKDICEFFGIYDLDSFKELVGGRDSTSRFKPLDLTIEPPPVNWFVHELLGVGDLGLIMGEPKLGKSWLGMDLATAVACGNRKWLGRTVNIHGRVLYVDEENPEDLIYQRFNKLGLTPEGAQNIRYLHRQGVRLDRRAEEILDEAFDYEPTLIVLDSLTRLHTEDENNAGAMAKLFNDGILPLARDTGCTVVLLHHVNKTDSTSSFKRSRGSSDIPANLDTGLDLRLMDSGALSLSLFASRRKAIGDTIRYRLRDTESGGVKLEVDTGPPF